jgi:thiosulfate dehydrogenase
MTTGLTGMVVRVQGGKAGFTASLRDFRPFLLFAAIVIGCDDNGIRSRADSTGSGAHDAAMGSPLSLGTGGPIDYTPPSDSLIPRDQLGASIRRGLALITHTTDSLPAFAPGNIQCSNCHIDAGRRRDAAALIGVYARFPKYMDRTGAVIPVEDRVNYCFTRSLAGTRIPNDSREMQDIVVYLSFISKGLPVGAHVKGEGMPTLTPLIGDSARGAAIFATTCTPCHGLDGQGKPPAFPALWGPRSYSIGASMAREERAATFIRHFMPQNKPGTLIDQQAYDVSAFINSHPRPDSPGKEKDWPAGGAPRDVPYNTVGHVAYRPPRTLIPRMNPAGSTVQPPPSIIRSGKAAGGAVTNQRTSAQ